MLVGQEGDHSPPKQQEVNVVLSCHFQSTYDFTRMPPLPIVGPSNNLAFDAGVHTNVGLNVGQR